MKFLKSIFSKVSKVIIKYPRVVVFDNMTYAVETSKGCFLDVYAYDPAKLNILKAIWTTPSVVLDNCIFDNKEDANKLLDTYFKVINKKPITLKYTGLDD